jgi:polyisoprenoid-binding protein YceI
MLNLKFLTGVLAILAMMTLSARAQQNPCNPCGGKAANPCGTKAGNPCGEKASNPCNPCAAKAAVAMNPCFAKMGTVFHVADPMQRNTITFTSQAPLEDMVGTANDLGGYVVFDPANPRKGVRGSIAVPVKKMDTGIPLRDEHMQSEAWLNARQHPHIKFTATESKDLKRVKRGEGFSTYDITLVGPLTVNGVTRPREIPVRMVYLEESEKTRSKRPGNLLAVRADFEVPLRDHKIEGFEGVVGSKVSESIAVDVSIFASDQAPKGASNPCAGKAANPCNPCAGKAANPCNPCAGKAANPCNPCAGK